MKKFQCLNRPFGTKKVWNLLYIFLSPKNLVLISCWQFSTYQLSKYAQIQFATFWECRLFTRNINLIIVLMIDFIFWSAFAFPIFFWGFIMQDKNSAFPNKIRRIIKTLQFWDLCRGKKHPNLQVQESGVAFEV